MRNLTLIICNPYVFEMGGGGRGVVIGFNCGKASYFIAGYVSK